MNAQCLQNTVFRRSGVPDRIPPISTRAPEEAPSGFLGRYRELARECRGNPTPTPRVVLGPPGAGKTHRVLDLLEAELDAGVPPERIAVLTFTRAARKVVRERVHERFGFGEKDLEWVRTIHSACFRLLGLDRDQVLTDRHWQAFGERHSYEFSPQGGSWVDLEDSPREGARRTPDDLLRYVHEWGRNARLTPEQALARCPVEGVPRLDFVLFEQRLADFKRGQGLTEFSDMLELVLEGGLCPDVDVIVVDEAQDLSPLQIAVVEQWFAQAERVYVAGDDDQAIHGFQAADPRWLLGLARRVEPEILRQSHRVPVAAHALACRIISRNRRRTPKEYRPTAEMGEVVHADLAGAVARLGEGTDALVLVRNRWLIGRVAGALMEQTIPFVVEGRGGPNPLGNHALLRALAAARWLADSEGAGCSQQALADLLERIPSQSPELPRGVKSRLAELKDRMLTLAQATGELGLGRLAEAIRDRGPTALMSRVAVPTRLFLDRLLSRFGEIPSEHVVLTTIHGSKGREAAVVVLLTDMTRATYRAWLEGSEDEHEAENRVWYVGVTRTKRLLVLVEPTTRRHYDFPTVPIEEGSV